jgi:hypothetical protein
LKKQLPILTMMKNLSLTLLLLPVAATFALVSEQAGLTRGRLFGAFSSPSGKLTLAPELVIPDPTDFTAILLQADAVQTLSSRIRACKSNAVILQGSLTALQTFTVEQERARGNFPGPVPVVYVGPAETELDMEAVAEAGADGVMIQVCQGVAIESLEEITTSKEWIDACKQAWECGLQPIPEVTVGEALAEKWSEDDVTTMVESICSAVGSDPVSILLTVNPIDTDQKEAVALPRVPKSLGKRVPLLGSVRVTAGDNRIGIETSRFKEYGFTGTLLRSDCVPGFRLQPDLDIVGSFWAACISDLKSTRSKSFSFRSKNNMQENAGQNWLNYQSDVMTSGALGDEDTHGGGSVDDLGDMMGNEQSGDYQAF